MTQPLGGRLRLTRRHVMQAGGLAVLLGLSAAQANSAIGGENMLFHLDFHVEYGSDMSQNDLFTIWAEEAGVALGAKEAGVVVDLWKAVGMRRVIAIVNVDSVDTLDQILLDLPIMKKMGQHVQVDVTALRTYEAFAADVKERVS